MRNREFSADKAAYSRRGFAGGVLAASVTALLPSAAPGASEKPLNSGTALGPRPEDLSVADWDEVHARYSNLLRLYGERLSPDEKRHTARILTTNQRMLASIRSFIVQNGDTSACTLRVYDPKQ
jgi:hypothetical protein